MIFESILPHSRPRQDACLSAPTRLHHQLQSPELASLGMLTCLLSHSTPAQPVHRVTAARHALVHKLAAESGQQYALKTRFAKVISKQIRLVEPKTEASYSVSSGTTSSRSIP